MTLIMTVEDQMTGDLDKTSLEKSKQADKSLNAPNGSVSEYKGRLPILGCLLGGCLAPIVATIIVGWIPPGKTKSDILTTNFDQWEIALGWICFSVFLLPIGAIIGGIAESIIRKSRRK